MNSPQAMIFLSSLTLISFLFYGLAITSLTFPTVSASYGGNETDYKALLSFKSTITHDPNNVLASWNHSFHFCDWSGISCGKRQKRVTALRLESQSLEGSLSPHVGNLSFLRELYLANLSGCSNLEELHLGLNKQVGSIPKEMSLLSKLSLLVIQFNQLTGGIPPFFGNITSMEVFAASANPLGGSIPDTLGLWKRLKSFGCGSCNLYGSIPHSIFNLSLLVNFSLPDNHLTGSLPLEFGNQLPNLVYLQLWGNELTGVLPPSLSNCSKLRHLEMTNNSFSGKLTIDFPKLRDINEIYLAKNNFHGCGEVDDMSFIDSLKNCTRLVALDLYNCNLTGVLPVSIGNLFDQLSFLSLGINQLSGSLPSSIGSLVGLTTLDLTANQFKGKIPTTIGKLQKLQLLALFSNQFSGPILDVIGNLSLLIELYLYSNNLQGLIPPSLGNCTELNYLDLSYNRLGGKIPKQLLQIPALTILLNLSHNSLYGSVPSEVKDLKMLNILDLSYNNLSANISILGECIGLSTLNLRGNIFQGIIPLSLSSLRGLEVILPTLCLLIGVLAAYISSLIPGRLMLSSWSDHLMMMKSSLVLLLLSPSCFFLYLFNLFQTVLSLDHLDHYDFEGKYTLCLDPQTLCAFSILGNNKLCGGLVTLELPKCKEEGQETQQSSQFLGNERFLKVSYNELLKATDGFSAENLIGEGGFSSVYKGILNSHDDRFFAVKVLHLHNRGALKSFLVECEAWRNIRHRNLLKIVTSFSSVDFQGNDFKAIVYQFMPNGSVHDWLHSRLNTSKLNLLQRMNIIVDVATALDYLHNRCQTTIIHGDLKPSNILLDVDIVGLC
ncbi:leucine-rich repeat protein [Tanacetum coccineum]